MERYNGLPIILGYLDLFVSFTNKTTPFKFCMFPVCSVPAATFIGLPSGLITVTILPNFAYYFKTLTWIDKSLFVLYAEKIYLVLNY